MRLGQEEWMEASSSAATEKGFKDGCSQPSSSSVTDNACAYTTIAIVIYYCVGKYESLRTAHEWIWNARNLRSVHPFGLRDRWVRPGRTGRTVGQSSATVHGWRPLHLFPLPSSTSSISSTYPISLWFFSHYPGRFLFFVFYHRLTRFRPFPIPLRHFPSRVRRYSAVISWQSATYMLKKRKNKILNASWMIAG